MEFISELHTHSRYAGACSDRLTLQSMDAIAREKGIGIMGTADFSHPEWFKEIKKSMEPQGNGLYKLKGSSSGVNFILSNEVCTIYPKVKGGKAGVFDRTGNVAKIHHGILVPDIETIEQVNEALAKFGSLSIDGRPQLSMTAAELVETIHGINERSTVFPAHAWTPWFGVFGSMGGFDSLEQAYEDQAKRIYAIETGLSADPAMFWRLSKLDKYSVISSGDAHSLPKLGREATVFEFGEGELSYGSIVGAMKDRKVKYTIEFYPEEGKYHYDGHRRCNISLSPQEAARYNGICPVCRKKLTLGVLHRVEELADREEGKRPDGAKPFVHTVPLNEIIASVSGKGVYTQYVYAAYARFIERFGTEFNVLLWAKIEDIAKVDAKVAEAIDNVRHDRASIKPGYDGVFGVIDVLKASVQEQGAKSSYGQRTIGGF
ncbi:MAG: DNA helicase UvrD [Candidatus Micrarchaeota archaeon]|nr:DNA helicase UvrD [Candidatus Micrarchaeota archaeon]